MLQGVTHVFRVDDPLGLPNFTRIVVQGETLAFEYRRLHVDPRSAAVVSWERVAAPGPSPAA